MSSLRTLQKCRKIMSLFEQTKPKVYVPAKKLKQTKKTSKSKAKDINKAQNNLSRSSSKDSRLSNRLKSRNVSRQSLSNQSINLSSSQLKNNAKAFNNMANKQNYQSPYNRETHYDKIMKLRAPKPQKRTSSRNSFIQSSLNTSLNSSFCSQDIRKNNNMSHKKMTRYQKIMKLKVQKPQVQSTLKNYTPQKSAKKLIKHQDPNQSSVALLRECKQRLKKQKQIQQKQDRLWKIFERERQLRVFQKRKNESKQYEKEMSLQKRFDSLVRKQLKKIQQNRSRDQNAEDSLFY